MHRFILCSLALVGVLAAAPKPEAPADGEKIAFIGNGLGERFLDHPWFETELQLRYPGKNLIVRNLARPGDTPGFRPHPSRGSQWAFPGAEEFHPQHQTHAGNGHHPSPDEWLTEVQADTILAFFGYNESFDGREGLERFKGELDAFVAHTLAQKYNGTGTPRLILVSPIAFEDLSASRDLPDGTAENANLKSYANVMAEVATAKNIGFIDLFEPSLRAYADHEKPLTRNGFLPNDDGYRLLGPALVNAVFGAAERISKADPESLAEVIRDKNWHWFHDYRMLNGVHVDGRRYEPFGPQNYPAEIAKIRALTENRDAAVHAAARGETFDLAAADARTPELPPVLTNYSLPNMAEGAEADQRPGATYLYGDEALAALKVPEGFKMEQFASEKEFPNLANPCQMSFDSRGRLWVSTLPVYPHWRPGDPKPDDKILIYEDTTGDGKADKETVFADGLHLPIGFEFAPEGVYVSQEPHLVLLRDTDGDDRADSREVVLTGFDTHDTHHAISAFTADPSGAILMCEGVFLHTNVETPYGPVRGVDGGFYRFSPQRTHLERTAQLPIPNPWGIAFDKWGQDFFLHTSGTALNWLLPGSLKTLYGEKNNNSADLIPEGHKVRPTSGLEFVSSRHFPDEMQGDILLCNDIGFLGLKQHGVADDGTGYKLTHRHDLVTSTDTNFRPVDMEFAPDGSLYLIDWHNVLIGHMQHNARDPLRDHVHGRIYRITHKERPLVTPAEIDGAPVATLLENLKLPELRTRYRTRGELRGRPAAEVLPAVEKWAAAQDDERLKLEALWVTWGHNRVNQPLLRSLLDAKDFHVRAAAVRVLRYHLDRVDGAREALRKALADPHGRVRLEAVVAATWLPADAAKPLIEFARTQPIDEWLETPIQTAASRLGLGGPGAAEENPAPPAPAAIGDAGRALFLKGHEIYHREGHCATCHQPDGKGLPEAGFPPIAGTDWVQGDPDRLIKLTLHGLMGPIEVNGKKYPGHVPMTPFAGMLDDEEVAAVLTYVRNHFSNSADPVTPERVAKVREETGTRGFYTAEELLKEHPKP